MVHELIKNDDCDRILTLTVVSGCSVLPQEMLVQQVAGHRLHLRIELNGFQGHLSDDFQRKRIFDRFLPGWSPNKWTVAVNKHRADLHRIKVSETLDNDVPSFPFVGGVDFL